MPRKQRLYSLFEKTNEGLWFRCSSLAFPKSVAVKVFQGKLLAHFLEGEPERRLKPVREDHKILMS